MSALNTRTLIISPAYLKENTIINKNVEDNILRKSIAVASDKYLQPIIGSQLYGKIISLISGGTMPAGLYKTLTDDFIVPVLTEYSVYEAAPFFLVKFRNKGLERQTSPEVSQPADFADANYVITNIRSTAEFYAELLIKHLRANTNLYPEYVLFLSLDDIAPAQKDFFSGIEFPKLNSRYGNNGCKDCPDNNGIYFTKP